ncbi:MAG: class I SAM-dependent methyltransferase [Hyphomicrobiaceae bacterium]
MKLPIERQISLIETPGFAGYGLIDSGNGRKLERFGAIVVDRPEPQALWQPALGAQAWAKAHAVFSASGEDDEKGRWRVDRPVPDSWPVEAGRATMLCRLQGLWHLGLFPEQYPHWQWMRGEIDRVAAAGPDRRPRVLNLFAYTGAASLVAAAAGAEVTHVDASKKAVAWARENQKASELGEAPIRWIVDDATKFVAREVRRERQYDVILVDPPKFGRGPAGETWDLFTHLGPLLSDCERLLAPGPSAMVLTVYAIRASALAFGQLLAQTLDKRTGTIDVGELAIREQSGRFAVPTSLFVRWSSSRTGNHVPEAT